MFGGMRLRSAIGRRDVEAVRRLLEKHPSLAESERTWECFHSCVYPEEQERDAQMMALILDHGGHATCSGAQGRLDTAANNDERIIAKVLLEHGADVNHVSWNGTPLHRAADWGYVEMVRLLLDHGAGVNATGYRGDQKKTPLDFALASLERGGTEEPTADRQATVELLISRGAKSSTPSKKDIVASVRKQASTVGSILRRAFESPGPLFSGERQKILSMWLANFTKNLEGVVTAIETGRDMGGNNISPNEVLAGLERMCSEYGRHDTLKRLEDVCGRGIRDDFERVLRELRPLAF